MRSEGKNGKTFFDVFPTLELNTELKNLFAVTKVTRVALTKARDFLKVYLFSEKLIQKKYIYQVEKAIRDQLFAGVQMTVKIIEKFSLSRQYTPEKLMDVYKDSILLELKEYSIFEFNLFRKADCIFENEDTLHLTLEETVISEGKGDELIRVLEKIFTERCGMSLKIHVDYKEAVESKARRNGELKIQQEVEAILSRLPRAAGGEEQSFSEPKPEKTVAAEPRAPKEAAQKRRLPRKGGFSKGGLQGQRPFWRRRLQSSGASFMTIRMWSTEEISRRKPSPSTRSRARWERWSSMASSSIWKPGISGMRRRF
ncbi:MAG: PolC-type DNA polymerase III N-terminal domain-containing protein [Lachnospiraceae bacterium]